MSVEPLVRVAGLGKRYPVLGHRGDRISALWDVVRGRPPRRVVSVLEDVNFEVRPGESLAVIGENGAGKSTLLKLLTGVLTPSRGSVSTRGSIGALLELGAGFHPELSGRDNVRLSAALHGLDASTLAARLPEIEAFADIGGYIDEPVKHYSSGMVVRLGFAVIAAVRPQLLITDEVLAVGDENFQRKCIRWLDDYLATGGTLLLVSHSMYHVQKLCRRAIWLHEGRVAALGDVFEVSQRYLAAQEARQAVEAAAPVPAGRPEFSVESVAINGSDGQGPATVLAGDRLVQDVVLHSRDGRAPVMLNGWVRADGTPVYGVSSEMDGIAAEALGDGRFRFRLCFEPLTLLPGSYRLRTHALDPEGLRLFDTLDREVEVAGQAREYGLVRLPHRWLEPGA
ncbi:ABC transporter ATP-binding protein [Arenimonas terrae]|uniref:ABC transporter ATP-binding protein n=1 Tax=Arenimonas terrae TaxID=2546226 RepID=A0A5C4RX40_9GAMM|nr:ABC transporter ATP-binding protein [Arenimonas terrae]TNJ35548.1 ABC transporter ATP-binding protein [Arenimonas terrae]